MLLRRSKADGRQYLRTEAVLLQAAIERAAAETESFGGAVGVALESREGFFDQQALGVFEAHLFETCRETRVRRRLEGEIESGHDVPRAHQHCPFDHVVQFAHVTR